MRRQSDQECGGLNSFPLLAGCNEVLKNFADRATNVIGKMSKSRTTLKTIQGLVDEFLRWLKRMLAVKNVVQGGKRGDLGDEEAKVISIPDWTGSNESNLPQDFGVTMESFSSKNNKKPLK